MNVPDHDCGRRENANVPTGRLTNSNERGVADVRGGGVPPLRTYQISSHPTKGTDEEQLAGIHLRRIEAVTHS